MELLCVVFSIAALVMASRARREVGQLRGMIEQARRTLERAPERAEPRPRSSVYCSPPAREAEPAPSPSDTLRELITAASPAASAKQSGRPPLQPPLAPPAIQPLGGGLGPEGAPVAAAARALAPGLEERVGARWSVWIGGVALALSGAYLVKYSFDSGILSPPVRIVLGLLFGALLIGAAEWARSGAARIAEALSAAGVADLFACLLGAVHLYRLIGPRVGFAGMAAVTALAVALSLRHGAFVALLGLLGGYLTPALLRIGEPQPSLLLYLFLLQAAVLAANRRLRVPLLSGLTWLGAFLWALHWIGSVHWRVIPPDDDWALGLFILGGAALVATMGRSTVNAQQTRTEWVLQWLNWVGCAVLGALLIPASSYGTVVWSFLAMISAGILVFARFRQEYDLLAGIPGLVTVALLLSCPLPGAHFGVPAFVRVLSGMAALFGIGAYACSWNSARPAQWMAVSLLGGMAGLMVAFWRLERLASGVPWWAIALGLAATYAVLAVPVAARRRAHTELAGALDVLAVGAVLLATMAAMLRLERYWLSTTLAMGVTAVAWLDSRLRLPGLRCMAWVLAACVILRLVLNPAVLAYPVAGWLVLNSALLAYGLAALAFAGAACLFGRTGQTQLRDALGVGSAILVLALISLQTRMAFHRSLPSTGPIGTSEGIAYAIAWGLYGWILLDARARRLLPPLREAGEAIGAIGILGVVVVAVLLRNPLWTHEPVGARPILNRLLSLYLLGCVPSLLLAIRFRQAGRVNVARVMVLVAIGLIFAWVSLSVRHAFQGTFLDSGRPSHAELYAYSLAWAVFATLLLAAGIAAGSRTLRLAALVIMSAAVFKVFLFDTSHLKDLYRVLSFLGLGASLVALGWLYQKFVVGGREQASAPAET